jgi:hypothetical protein
MFLTFSDGGTRHIRRMYRQRRSVLRIAYFGVLIASSFATAAVAAPVMDGTVSSVATFNPKVSLSSPTSTYSAMNGSTFEISGTGGFSGISGTTGLLNGALTFSNTIGDVITQAVSNFFVFSDAKGGTYNYSVSSVQTNAFVNKPGVASSGTLFTLGSLLNSNLGYLTPTPASLSIQFNNTGTSAYSSALTLSVPPVGGSAVPEPASWAMMIGGFGLIGGAMRRHNNVRTKVSFA